MRAIFKKTNYPEEIKNCKHEYVRFFIKRFPFEIFKIIMKPHLEKKRINYIIKEITETVGAFNILSTFLKKLKVENFVLYELVSGDALFSHFVSYNFPSSKIYAVDLKFSIEYINEGKSKFLNNLYFIECDIKRIGNEIDSDFIVAIHACNELSEVVINLATKNFLVIPCCIGSEKYRDWMQKNKTIAMFFDAIKNEYYKWCFYLGLYANQKGFKVYFKKDEKILSEKNIIVFGSKQF